MKITEYIKQNKLFLDGSMGTLLQARGLKAGELPEEWNLSHREIITDIHRAYFDAGSNVVNTNTFGANLLKFKKDKLEEIIKAAMENARLAAKESTGVQEKWVALDIGPSGKMLEPFGDLSFEDAVCIFAETVKLGAKYGADLVFIETMNDSLETKAALLAAKENCDLPVFVSNAYGEDGKLMTGACPEAMVALLEGMHADAVGVNCSLGPKALGGVVDKYLECASVPVIMKPNAGLPKSVGGKTEYDILPNEFAADVAEFIKKGVRISGGCCGTTPEYIQKLVNASADIEITPIEQKNFTVVSSYTHAVHFDKAPILIGERINPTGKKRFKTALLENDVSYILKEAVSQKQNGAHLLDVNVGLPEIDEEKMLVSAVKEIQAVVDLPLQIDTSDIKAMESALRCYNGKAMINSVNGKKESMQSVFPLAYKYGGVIVALTLDENGIPQKAQDRLKIAEKILTEAKKYGIDKKDIIFDPLALTISADADAANQTLKAVELITNQLGAKTSLGVSNVSFGLPDRDVINAGFFTLALGRGLSAGIINPYSAELLKAYHSYMALSGLDKNCADYIAFADELKSDPGSAVPKTASDVCDLQQAIEKGLKDTAAELTVKCLETEKPLDIVNKRIIPALDRVGVGFENKTVYLPALLMSAEAAQAAFEQIKTALSNGAEGKKCPFVLATVKGDIHDIGKNIVKLLLQNYGFEVCDLGKDVPPEEILKKVIGLKAPLLGLSALMTTTVPAMEETIKLVKEKAPFCKTVVGGAVLNEQYAAQIGADKYAKDAMETVRFADEIYKGL